MTIDNILFFRVENGLRNFYLANALQQRYGGCDIKIVHYNDLYKSDYGRLLEQRPEFDSQMCWQDYYEEHKKYLSVNEAQVYLVELQQRYHINLTRALFAERHIGALHHDEVTIMTCLLWRFLESVVCRYKNPVFINCNLEHFHDVVAYYFCKTQNIPTIIVQDMWTKGYIAFSINSMHSIPTGFAYEDLELVGEKLPMERIDDIIYGKLAPIGSQQTRKKSVLKHAFQLLRLVKSYVGALRQNHLSGLQRFRYDFLNVIRDNTFYVKRKLRREWNAIKNSVCVTFDDNPDLNKPFYYYPIHYQPEVSTLIWGYYYVDQVHVIENLARTLPAGIELYVKDHKANYGYRETRDYLQILDIPNVRLLSHEVNNEQLIANATCLVTLNGSAALERLKYKKPYFILGDGRFRYISEKSYVNDYKVMEELIVSNNLPAPTDEDIARYRQGLWDSTIHSDVMRIPGRQSEGHIREDYSGFAMSAAEGLISILEYLKSRHIGYDKNI